LKKNCFLSGNFEEKGFDFMLIFSALGNGFSARGIEEELFIAFCKAIKARTDSPTRPFSKGSRPN
jgi:hypothetical protein